MSTIEAAIAAVHVLDDALTARIQEELKRCADKARTDVLFQLVNGKSPTPAQCRESVVDSETGQTITMAMLLGKEMHKAARECAQQELSKLYPGGFRLEQRYRYDPESGDVDPISPEEEEALRTKGRGKGLLGTLKPDVVLHSGDPRKVLDVFDFKFPCVNTDRAPGWSEYPEGHPFQGRSQGDMYSEAFKLKSDPARVVPRIGIVRQ